MYSPSDLNADFGLMAILKSNHEVAKIELADKLRVLAGRSGKQAYSKNRIIRDFSKTFRI
jgi:hypothetical protein